MSALSVRRRLWASATICLMGLAMIVIAGCGVGLVVGSGNAVTEEREISGVEGVALSFVGDLRITQGDEEKLVITGDDNVLPLITTEVKDGVLTIGSKSTLGIPVVNNLRYDLTVRNLNKPAAEWGRQRRDEWVGHRRPDCRRQWGRQPLDQ